MAFALDAFLGRLYVGSMLNVDPTYPYPVRTDAEWADAVEEGLPIKDFVGFGRASGFTVDELAKLVHIPPRTYARRVAAKARLDIPEGERAVRIMRLYDHAKHFFGTH